MSRIVLQGAQSPEWVARVVSCSSTTGCPEWAARVVSWLYNRVSRKGCQGGLVDLLQGVQNRLPGWSRSSTTGCPEWVAGVVS